MSIRFAAPADLAAIVELGRATHARSRYAALPYSGDKLQRQLAAVIEQGAGRYALLVSTDAQGQVAGLLLGVIEQALFTEALSASIMYFIVDPQTRMGGHGPRLLRAFERWAQNRQVLDINFGINSGIEAEQTARFARRMGYRGVGENLVKEMAAISASGG